MAEIILPPEENEETPQAPELNIDKPTENSKVITIEFEAKKTNKVSTKDTNQQLYTTDTDAWFEFKETSLEGANGTYSVVFRNRHDGSIFQRTGDVVNGVAYYKIPRQEIRHAGAWRGQIVYTLSNGDTTAREFGYDVKGHILDGKDVREIVVEDFETLMSQLNSMKDNAEQELADLVNTAERNELERQQFYESLVEDINDLQENYQELLDTGVLQTNINEKLEALEEEYAPKLTEVTTQLASIGQQVNPFESNVDDTLAKVTFIEDMNNKAKYIGMTDTTFVNPHGLGDPEQITTAKDMLLMGVHAVGYDDLVESWSKKSYALDIKGPREREMTLNTTVSSAVLEDHYNLFGGKTGTLAGSGGGQYTQNLISIVNAPNNNWFIGVVLDATGDRFTSAKDLFNIANLAIEKNEKIMATNTLLFNSDFRDGLDTWTISSGEPEASTDDYFSAPQSLKVFSNGTSTQVRKDIGLEEGALYYASAKVKCVRYERGSIGFQIGAGNTTYIGVSDVTDDFVNVSHVFRAVSTGASLYVGSMQSADLDGYVDNFTLVNLSQRFGEGNEPSKDYMDNHLWGGIQSEMGGVCIAPVQNSSAYNHDNLTVLFEKNGDSIGYPASLTKVMTCMVLLDNIKDINKRIEITGSDITSGSGPTFYNGDVITVRDALHCMMLPSSNTIANAVARVVGKKILIDAQ